MLPFFIVMMWGSFIMGCNYFSDKSINKLKAVLFQMGYTKDYPKAVFGTGLMLCFGMGKKRAIEWIDNFETAKKIEIKEGVINWVM